VVEVDVAVIGNSKGSSSSSSSFSRVTAPSDADPFDLNELNSVMQQVSSITTWIHSLSQERMDLDSTIRKLVNEKNRLTTDLNSLENIHEARIHRIKSDHKVIEDNLSEYIARFGEIHKPSGSTGVALPFADRANIIQSESKIAQLESLLEYERSEREKTLSENRSLRNNLDNTLQELQKYTGTRKSIKYNEQTAVYISDEVETLRSEILSTRHEYNAVCHHRSILRETIEMLEKEISQQNETVADLKHIISTELPSRFSRVDNNQDNDDLLKKQNHRYRTKLNMLEELMAIYRNGVISLYPDGSSYGAAQFSMNTSNLNWVEKELNTIKNVKILRYFLILIPQFFLKYYIIC